MFALQERVNTLFASHHESSYEKSKSKTAIECEDFLKHIGSSITECLPQEVCLYLAWKDGSGKTPVHNNSCPAIGNRSEICKCKTRLAWGTVQYKISHLRAVFESMGRLGPWHESSRTGNPMDSQAIQIYAKQIKVEQSKAHVLTKQATPMFQNKLRLIAMYIDRCLHHDPCKPSKQVFILARDQALLKMMFFGGDRASDIGQMLCQEVKQLPNKQGVTIRHTWGKTHRCDRPNVFSLFRCHEEIICPVLGLQTYIETAAKLGVNIKQGFLFRLMAGEKILDRPMSYAAVYDRLKHYLDVLNINGGETPHSLRAGCAITLKNAAKNTQAVMQHIGWASEASASHYTRSAQVEQTTVAATCMRLSQQNGPKEFVDDTTLPNAI